MAGQAVIIGDLQAGFVGRYRFAAELVPGAHEFFTGTVFPSRGVDVITSG